MGYWKVEIVGHDIVVVEAETMDDVKRWARLRYGKDFDRRGVTKATEHEVGTAGKIVKAERFRQWWNTEPEPSTDDMIRSNGEGFTLADLER
jgi:hypothetical protein